jgi:hypothetical protein
MHVHGVVAPSNHGFEIARTSCVHRTQACDSRNVRSRAQHDPTCHRNDRAHDFRAERPSISYTDRAQFVMQATLRCPPAKGRERRKHLGYQAGRRRRRASAFFFRVNGDAAAAAEVSLGYGLEKQLSRDGLVLYGCGNIPGIPSIKKFIRRPVRGSSGS